MNLLKTENRADKRLKALILAVFFCCIAIAARFSRINLCFINAVFGVPCPACGMTRAHMALMRLDFKAAFNYHPLFFFSFIIAAQIIITFFKPSLSFKKVFVVLDIIMAAALIVCYTVRMILFFPDTAPLDYNYNSLLWRIYTFIFKK